MSLVFSMFGIVVVIVESMLINGDVIDVRCKMLKNKIKMIINVIK